MILAIVSILIGFILIVFQFPIHSFTTNLISIFVLSGLLIFFGAWLLYHESRKTLQVKQAIQSWKLTLTKTHTDYPHLSLMCHKTILNDVVHLIKQQSIQHAKPMLLSDVRLLKQHSKFSFFLWLFQEQDERSLYQCYSNMFKKIHEASIQVLKNMAKPEDHIIDVSYSNMNFLSSGLYILRIQDQFEFIKLPFHIRLVLDDFYGYLTYDHALENTPHSFSKKQLQIQKTKVKQTSSTWFQEGIHPIKKATSNTLYQYQVTIQNDYQVTFYSDAVL